MNNLLSPFEVVDFPIIRSGKNESIVELDSVVANGRVIYLKIDEVSVRVEKLENQSIGIRCSCEYCGKKGVATKTLCRRQVAAILYLGRMNGRVSELYVKKEVKDVRTE